MQNTQPFDVAEFLDAPETIAAFLTVAFESGDPHEILSALNDVARARGMTALAQETGLKRAALYKSLSSEGNPTLSTLLEITKALGVKLSVAA